MKNILLLTLFFQLMVTVTSCAQPTFVNPIAEGRDPWVVKTDSCYYFCSTYWNSSIVVWKSDKLTDMGIRRVVWTPSLNGWNRTDLWAPELHYINGKWYIYYTAGTGAEYDQNSGTWIWHWQRAGVLECLTQDPTTAAYIDRGMLYTGENIQNWNGTAESNTWAIDPTPLEMNGNLYLIWSGWDSTANMANNGFTQQNLYIAQLNNPYNVATNRIKISAPTYPWEIGQVQRVIEGPEILAHGYKVYCIYSTPDFWTLEYKMGQLSISIGDDPMIPANWTKKSSPVFEGTSEVYSVGHGSFATSPGGKEQWLIYRSKQKPEGGWERDVRLQKFTWNPDGSPNFGVPSPAGTVMCVPSGEETNSSGTTFTDGFNSDFWDNWRFLGWDGNIFIQNQQLHLGAGEQKLYAGDKALVRGYDWKNFVLEVNLKLLSGVKDAGLIFRVIEAGFGKNLFKGYAAALKQPDNIVYLARFDGSNSIVVNTAPLDVKSNTWYNLKVETQDQNIEVYIDGELKISFTDSHHLSGMAGVRIVETHAAFDNFSITSKASSVTGKNEKPTDFKLHQNFPNPFNNSTLIQFQLPESSHVLLNVYNISGQLLSQLVNEFKQAGNHAMVFSGDNYPSGLYIYHLKADNKILRKKMTLLK